MKKNIYFYLVFIFFLLSIILLFINTSYFKVLFAIIWGLASVMILLGGIYFSFKYKFLQLNIKSVVTSLKMSNTSSGKINSFEALSMSMAEKIGVGSLSGIAMAIYFGGVGTIFWICIFSILCSINSYVESRLGIKYQVKDNNNYIGGPSFYLKNVLNNYKLSKLYAFLIIVSYAGIFIAIQANTIVKSIVYSFNINMFLTGLILVILVSLALFKSINQLVKFTSFLVPFMIIIYMFFGGIILINNITSIPSILINIIESAFSFKSGLSSFIYIIVIGIQRAIFATEAGIGTTAIASSLTNENGHKQGLTSILSVYITCFIVCLTTAIVIITSDYQSINFESLNGIELTIYAFNYHLGSLGNIVLTIVTVLFAYTTIISGYFFGEMNLKILIKPSPAKILVFKIFAILLIIFGIFTKPLIIWKLVDIFIAFLAIINIYAMFKLRNNV